MSAEEQAKASAAEKAEKDLLLDHAYDGIQEYDNPMPGWWKALFWASIVFAAGYFFHFHLSPNGQSIRQGYAADVKQADEEAAKRAAAEQVTEESLAKGLGNEGMVLAGQALFAEKCVTCHESRGQGKIGPNLTDDHWIHGKGKLLDIYKVVHDGVPEKGMIAWGKTLKPVELRQVVAFVGSIRNTNVPGKAPEGPQVEK
jgi:cytochrome c oxidase cbb3-type subunit 3